MLSIRLRPANSGNSVDRNDLSEAAVQQGQHAAPLRRTINSNIWQRIPAGIAPGKWFILPIRTLLRDRSARRAPRKNA